MLVQKAVTVDIEREEVEVWQDVEVGSQVNSFEAVQIWLRDTKQVGRYRVYSDHQQFDVIEKTDTVIEVQRCPKS